MGETEGGDDTPRDGVVLRGNEKDGERNDNS